LQIKLSSVHVILLSTFQGARKRRDVQEYSGYNCDVSSGDDKSTFVVSHRIDLLILKPKSTVSLNTGRDRHDYPYLKAAQGSLKIYFKNFSLVEIIGRVNRDNKWNSDFIR
jgi:hypothetical protein